MKYLYTNEPIRKGDRCILVWQATCFGTLKDDAPQGKPGETVAGKWHKCNERKNGKDLLIPVVVEKIDDKSLYLRLYRRNESGVFEPVYSNGQPEPLSLEIRNEGEETIFPRLIKTSDWLTGCKPAPAKEKLTTEDMEALEVWLVSRGYHVGNSAVANGLRKMADYFNS